MAFRPQDILKKEKTVSEREALSPKERLIKEKAELEKEKGILEEEKIYREGVVSIKDLIAPAALEVTPTFLKVGDKFLRTIFVIGYPRYIAVGWFAPIINLSATLDIAMFFYPVKSDIILKQLRNKVGALEAQILSDREKGAPRDPIRETALRDIE